MSSLGLSKNYFMQEGYVTQIGYPLLRIDILNNIDGVKFDDAYTIFVDLQLVHQELEKKMLRTIVR